MVVGHSFGGAVVYTALQQILAGRFIDSHSGKTYQGGANGFGDLVVLVNPAFEALRYATLYDISQEYCRRYFPTQLPKLVILTSEADYATKLAFPAGRSLSTLFETHNNLPRHYCARPGTDGTRKMVVDEGKADRHAVGHFAPFLTHHLKPAAVKIKRGGDFDYRRLREMWKSQQPAGSLQFEHTQTP